MDIISNGSKCAGELPDTIEELHRVLKVEPLDPIFENYGNFVLKNSPTEARVWGNFYELSHVFDIRGTRAELSETIRLIRANQRTKKYKAARAEYLERVQADARREEERREERRRNSREALLAKGE
jgi:hypothetical protein